MTIIGVNGLEAVTELNFNDGEKTIVRRYNGLLNFQEGEIISLIGMQGMPVSIGNYVVRKGRISNHLSFHFDGTDDLCIRAYRCEKIVEQK